MNLYQTLGVIFKKEGKLPHDWQPFIINRFLSFHNTTFGLASKVDKYVFWVDKKLLETIYMNVIPESKKQPWFHYIRKPQEGENEYGFLLHSLQKFYKWTDGELEANSPLILKLIQDKKVLEKMMRFIGADLKYFKKHGIDILRKEGGLGKWRG